MREKGTVENNKQQTGKNTHTHTYIQHQHLERSKILIRADLLRTSLSVDPILLLRCMLLLLRAGGIERFSTDTDQQVWSTRIDSGRSGVQQSSTFTPHSVLRLLCVVHCSLAAFHCLALFRSASITTIAMRRRSMARRLSPTAHIVTACTIATLILPLSLFVSCLSWDRSLSFGSPSQSAGLAYSAGAAFPLTERIFGIETNQNEDANDETVFVVFGGYPLSGISGNRVYWSLYSESSTQRAITWRVATPVGPSPAPRSFHNAISIHAVMPFAMLVYGGGDAAQAYGSLWLYDLVSNSWAGLGPAPFATPPSSCIKNISRNIYGSTPQDRTCLVDQCASVVTGTASEDGRGCPWPMARGAAVFSLVGDAAYLHGGALQDGTITGDLWELDLSPPAILRLKRHLARQRASADGCYVPPDPDDEKCPITWRLLSVDDASGRLAHDTAAPAPAPRDFHSSTGAGNLFLISGGLYDWYDITMTTPDIWAFNRNTRLWVELKTSTTFPTSLHPLDRMSHLMVPVDDSGRRIDFATSLCRPNMSILIFGGSNSLEYVIPNMLSLTPPTSACPDTTGAPIDTDDTWAWHDQPWTTNDSPVTYLTHLYGLIYCIAASGRSVFTFGGHDGASVTSAQMAIFDLGRQVVTPLDEAPTTRAGDNVVPNECRSAQAIATYIASGVQTAGLTPTGCAFHWPAPRFYAQAVKSGESYIMYGGYLSTSFFGTNSASSELWSLNVRTHEWSLMGGNLTGSWSAHVSGHWPFLAESLFAITPRGRNGSFILWGGLDPRTEYTTTEQLWEYDIERQAWVDDVRLDKSTTPAGGLNVSSAARIGATIRDGYLFPLVRSNVARCVSSDGRTLYMVGGYIGTARLPDALVDLVGSALLIDLWQLDLATLTWTALTPHFAHVTTPTLSEQYGLPQGRFAHNIAYWNNQIIMVGGLWDPDPTKPNYLALTDIWRIDLTEKVWHRLTLPSNFSPRQASTVGVLHDRFYILFGGAELFADIVFDSWEYDLLTGDWLALDAHVGQFPSDVPLPTEREGAPGIAFPELSEIVWFGGILTDALGDLHTFHADDVTVRPMAADNQNRTLLSHDVLAAHGGVTNELPTIRGLNASVINAIAFHTLAGAIKYFQTVSVGFFRIAVASPDLTDPSAVVQASKDILLGMDRVPITGTFALRGLSSLDSTGRTVAPILDCSLAGFYSRSCFSLSGGSSISLRGVRISNGSSSDGGAFRVFNSDLTLIDVRLEDHHATEHGGAIFAMDSNITLARTVVAACSGGLLGGSIYAIRTRLNLTSCQFSSNSVLASSSLAGSFVSAGSGGAIFMLSSSIRIVHSSFNNNRASEGGAIGVDVLTADEFSAGLLKLLTSFQVTNTTFQGNTARLNGGALTIAQIERDVPIIRWCSFYSNTAETGNGGGIFLRRSSMQLDRSRFIGNSAPFGGGGGAYWEHRIDTPLCCTAYPNVTYAHGHGRTELAAKNFAAYGNWIASPPVAYKLALRNESTHTIADTLLQDSGGFITPHIDLSLFDFYHNQVSVDNTSFFTMEPGNLLAGASSVRATRGVATFDDVLLLLLPAETQVFTFTSSIELPLLYSHSDTGQLNLTLETRACQSGTYNSMSSQGCLPCPIGYFGTQSMQSACEACQPGRYANTTGSTSCFACSPGTASSISGLSSPCPFCPRDSFAFTPGQVECAACQAGLQCSLGSAYAEKGRWLVPNEDGATPKTIACPWTNCDGDGRCGSNRLNPPEVNPLCGRCEAGFREINHDCIRCDATDSGRVVLALFLSLILVIILHRLARRGVGETEIIFYFIQQVNFQSGHVSTWLGWVAFFDLSPSKASGGLCILPMEPYEEMAFNLFGPFILVLMLLAIFITHSLFTRSSRGRAFCGPDTGLGSWFGVAAEANDPNRMAARQSIRSTRRSAILDQLPTNGGVGGAATHAGYKSVMPADGGSPHIPPSNNVAHAPSSSASEGGGRWVIGPYVRTLLSIYMLSYQQVSTVVLSHFLCVDTGSSQVVYVSPTMDCDSRVYHDWLVIWSLMLIFWVVGGPVLIIVWLYRNREKVRIGDTRFGAYFGVLYEGYSPSSYWFVAIVLFRRSVFVVLDVFLQTQIAIKICAYVTWNYFLLLVHIKISPYQSPLNHLHGTISLAVIGVISTLLMLGLDGTRSEIQLTIAVQILISILFFTTLTWMVVRVLFVSGQRFVRQHRYSMAKVAKQVQLQHQRQATQAHEATHKQKNNEKTKHDQPPPDEHQPKASNTVTSLGDSSTSNDASAIELGRISLDGSTPPVDRRDSVPSPALDAGDGVVPSASSAPLAASLASVEPSRPNHIAAAPLQWSTHAPRVKVHTRPHPIATPPPIESIVPRALLTPYSPPPRHPSDVHLDAKAFVSRLRPTRLTHNRVNHPDTQHTAINTPNTTSATATTQHENAPLHSHAHDSPQVRIRIVPNPHGVADNIETQRVEI